MSSELKALVTLDPVLIRSTCHGFESKYCDLKYDNYLYVLKLPIEQGTYDFLCSIFREIYYY